MNPTASRTCLVSLLSLCLSFNGWAQAQRGPVGQQPGMPQQPGIPTAPTTSDTAKMRLNYVLGVNDQILIRVPDVDELNDKAFRVDQEGNLYLPLVGTIRVVGMTVQQVEAELVKQLSVFVRAPRVTVSVVQYRSDPVFFVGAFNQPGIYPLQGSRTLLEMLTVVGGLATNASRRLRVTRRLDMGRIPLSGAVDDPERSVSAAEISLTRLMETVNPEEDITLMPYDVIRASTEEMVYITGQVGKVGGIPLVDKDSISVIQALAVSGGIGAGAKPEKAVILRPILDSARRAEIPLDVKAILAGKANDFPLLPNDVLVIPGPTTFRQSVQRFMTVAIPALVTSLITSLIFVAVYG